jgi:FtsP/CotA-like multicopper oxidase with cupredoxin domain
MRLPLGWEIFPPRLVRSRPARTVRQGEKLVAVGLSTVLAMTAAGFGVEALRAGDDGAPLSAAASRPRPVAPKATSQPSIDLKDGTKLAAWKMVGDVKEFTLTFAAADWQTAPGITKKAFTVNGGVPAPTIRVDEGDKLRFRINNQMPEPTSIHWHGMDLPNSQDGVPGITQKEIPAKSNSFVYEWTAISPGTHWYHSHMDGTQEGKGVYGALIVVPKVDDIASDRDYTIVTGDGALGFVFNGKSFPSTRRLFARVGDRVRIRLINGGPNMFHAIHLHLGYFEVVARDGHNLAVPEKRDTVTIGVGETIDILWVPTRIGNWMLHCHVFAHSETKNGMTGMVTLVDVSPADGVVVPNVPVGRQ